MNDAACRALGYSREELVGMTISDIDPKCPPEIFQNTGATCNKRTPLKSMEE
ncbi:MAG: PAS domain S-box protein [Geobacteraceae bacterium]